MSRVDSVLRSDFFCAKARSSNREYVIGAQSGHAVRFTSRPATVSRHVVAVFCGGTVSEVHRSVVAPVVVQVTNLRAFRLRPDEGRGDNVVHEDLLSFGAVCERHCEVSLVFRHEL